MKTSEREEYNSLRAKLAPIFKQLCGKEHYCLAVERHIYTISNLLVVRNRRTVESIGRGYFFYTLTRGKQILASFRGMSGSADEHNLVKYRAYDALITLLAKENLLIPMVPQVKYTYAGIEGLALCCIKTFEDKRNDEFISHVNGTVYVKVDTTTIDAINLKTRKTRQYPVVFFNELRNKK